MVKYIWGSMLYIGPFWHVDMFKNNATFRVLDIICHKTSFC